MPITKDQIREFCPTFRFHQFEKNFPCSIEYLCTGGWLKSLSNKFEPIQLSASDCQTILGNSAYATSTVEHDVYVDISGSQFGGEVSRDGHHVTAPIYYAVNEYKNFIDISYLVLYAFQDGITTNVSHFTISTIYCIVRDYGEHQGDFERVIVRVTSNGGSIEGIGFEAHGDVTWFSPSKCRFEPNSHHVIVNSALGGHSNWNMPQGTNDTYFVDEAYPIVVDGFQTFVNLDFCSYINDSGIHWKPYTGSLENLRQLGLDIEGKPISDQKWSTYCGRLGLLGTLNNFKGYACTYLDGRHLSRGDQNIINVLGTAAEVLGKIPEDKRNADGPTGPGDRDWTRPGTPQVIFQPWSNGGDAWNGIEAVVNEIIESMTVHRFLTAGSKIMACDARHRDARGFAFYLQNEPLERVPSASSWQIAQQPDFQTDMIKQALLAQPFAGRPALTLDQIWACNPLITNRNDGGGDAANTFLFYPAVTSAPPGRSAALNPAAWQVQRWSADSVESVAENLREALNHAGAASAGAKIAADDRRHGDAWAFMFWNPTMTSDDVVIVLEPAGWANVTFPTRNAGDHSENEIVALLNGGPLPAPPGRPKVCLDWAQICASKVIFTNRQEGDDDGATFVLLYPLLK